MKSFLLLILLASQFAFADECAFSTAPTVVFKADHELHQIWIEENKDIFSSTQMPHVVSFTKYLASIKSKLSNLAPDFLLRKQYDDFLNSGLPEVIAEAPNMLISLDSRFASLHPVTCLEALLLSQQADRGLSWETPMEFSAFLLEKADATKKFIRIYYSTNDRPGGKINSKVMDLIQADLNHGWILANHLHNHNFNMSASDKVTLVGGPSPGLSDVALYKDIQKSMGLKSAAVTNGFNTLSIDGDHFNDFHSR